MRILLDTNILIYREDDRIVSENIQEIIALLNKTGVAILIHPLSLQDFSGDKDKRRQQITLSKVKTYNFLESPPNPQNDAEYLKSVKEDSAPLTVDDVILYSVHQNAVDFLITEDKRLHKKANRLGLDDRVLFIEEALVILRQYLDKEWVIKPPALQQLPVYNLNLRDPFFTSLKEEYAEFSNWFSEIARKGRKCFVYIRKDGEIGALLIYKIEEEPMACNPPLAKSRRLKLSTFKVSYEGHKIGELFIKLSVDLAVKNEVFEIYLTHFTRPEDRLVDLISEYGFRRVAVNPRGEDIFLKKLIVEGEDRANMSPTDIGSVFYPSFYDGAVVKKFIAPIRPEYHRRLFTDFPGRQLEFSESNGEFIIEGNTIRKAYLCHARPRRMKTGDILLFYLSRYQELTSIGVVESVEIGLRDSQEIFRRVGKRTVYSINEIEKMAEKPTTVILFRHHFHFPKSLSLRSLKSMGVLAGPPQSIIFIQDDNYARIRQEGGINARFTVH
jgi:rRNA-processing protein FCF1